MIICEQSTKYFDIVSEFSEELARFLQVAFAHGAIVAGGFPRILRRTGQVTLDTVCKGDIDLFFSDRQRAELFLFTVNSGYKHLKFTENSKGGYATDLVLEFEASGVAWFRCRVQAITCRFGSPEEILEAFDIHNCMVAFDSEHLWYHPDQAKYEAVNLLSIANWGNPLLASRLAKYLHHHNYDGIVPEDRELLAGWLLKTYDQLPKDGVLKNFTFLDRNVFRHYVARIMKSETALQIPELRQFFDMFHPDETHNWNYNAGLHAFKERTGIDIPLPPRPEKLPIPTRPLDIGPFDTACVDASPEAIAMGLQIGDLDPYQGFATIQKV